MTKTHNDDHINKTSSLMQKYNLEHLDKLIVS